MVFLQRAVNYNESYSSPFELFKTQSNTVLKVSYGGDFEAQRHWMELTINLSISEWYSHDLQYWGLDYPPLIAYGSYILGRGSEFFVGEESVKLYESRAYEDPLHKFYMRCTVLFFDLIFLSPITYIISKRLTKKNETLQLWFFSMISPAFILIDNGHFQYNNVCIALSLASFHFMTLCPSIGIYDIIGSILFCLALNWKQMSLYYAPAVFAYLLGKCFSETSSSFSLKNTLINVAKLGITVISTFGILWYPFYYFRDNESDGIVDIYKPILLRIFPFSRGLFEGKVANLWCVLNVKPISIRSRIPDALQPTFALLLTCLLMLPFCIMLFQAGLRYSSGYQEKEISRSQLKLLLWGCAGVSISFFLASFQVHEKSILLPLAPLLFLDTNENIGFIGWSSIVCTWCCWHLLVTDRLQGPYFALLVLYLCFRKICYGGSQCLRVYEESKHGKGSFMRFDGLVTYAFSTFIIPCSMLTMLILHISEALFDPPSKLPDLYPVLWTIVGCGCFVLIWLKSLFSLLIANAICHNRIKVD